MPEGDRPVRIPVAVVALAASYGEHDLVAAGGAKSAVAVGKRHVFKVVESGKGEGTEEKERRVLTELARRLPDWAEALVPGYLDGHNVPGLGFVEVHTRLPGYAPRRLSSTVAQALGRFLAALHGGPSLLQVTEFENEPPRDFFEYLLGSAAKFHAKLTRLVGPADLLLVTAAEEIVQAYVASAAAPPPLVLVHKDLSLPNLLVEDDELTGVVDWAAAQSAPREWEFAILEQRFGDSAAAVRAAYGLPLDEELLRVCSALQAIRFWKSFPDDADFVEDQRRLLGKVLAE